MRKITADDEIEDVMKQIGVGPGEKLRESAKRENTLEKFAQLRSRNPKVTLDIKNTPTAFVKADEDEEEGEFKAITITSRKFEQSITDLPEDYFDYLIQRAQTVHECGHLLYSSWPAMEKYIEKVRDLEDSNQKRVTMFKNLANVLEDGAIEKFLNESFRAEEELFTLRATLHEDNFMGKEYSHSDGVEYHYPFFFAAMTAALNIGVYDNEELDKLLDEDNEKHCFGDSKDKELFVNEMLPQIRRYVADIQNEPNAEVRMGLCYNLWRKVREHLDSATVPGDSEFSRKAHSMGSDSYTHGVPENTSEGHGEQEASAKTGDGEDSNESLGEKRAKEAESVKDGEQASIEEKAEQGIAAETRQEEGDWSDELEEIMQSLEGGDGIDEIAIADSQDVRPSHKNQAERRGRRCERMFARQLKELQRDKTRREKRRGRLDNRKMVDAKRGSTRIFKQTVEGEKKNYSCMIIVDRSGSMSDRIEEVEIAAGAVAYGLEANGVSTSIIDTHKSMTTLSKPFGSDVDHHTGTIFGGRTEGGTPLRYTIQFARQRMKRGKGDVPFAIIITDGKPNSRDKFKEQVRSANFPTLGLYLTDSKEHVKNQLELYDKAVAVGQDEDVGSQLVSLIRGVVL